MQQEQPFQNEYFDQDDEEEVPEFKIEIEKRF